MATVWVICGAGSGVGKTTLARRLCEVLPAAVYAKGGHGRVKPGKCENFFRRAAELKAFVAEARERHEHVVIESNAWARAGRGDVTIYIDGVSGKTRFRRDAGRLRAAADVRIAPGAVSADWEGPLREALGRGGLCDAVCGVLSAQQRHLFGARPHVRTKVWIEAAGAHVFGVGLARLLRNVARLGSLRKAAEATNMSYRRAWDLIGQAEGHLGAKLLDRHAGGRGGGQSTLLPAGERLLEVFERLTEEVGDFVEERFAAAVQEALVPAGGMSAGEAMPGRSAGE